MLDFTKPQDSEEDCSLQNLEKIIASNLRNNDLTGGPPLPIIVNTTFIINDITKINEIDGQTSFFGGLKQSWFEKRLVEGKKEQA